MKITVFLVVLLAICAVNASPFKRRFLKLEDSENLPRLLQGGNSSAGSSTTTTTVSVAISNPNGTAAAGNNSGAGNASAASNNASSEVAGSNSSAAVATSNNTGAAAANNATAVAAASNATAVEAAPANNNSAAAPVAVSNGGAFFTSSFGNGACAQCSDQCNSVESAINGLNDKANSLCNISDIPEVIGNMTEQAAGMLAHIYIVNQWFYNKPYVLEIGNNQWDVLNVIYPKYQHVLQQVEILKQDRDNQAICLDRYGIQNKINVLNLMHDRLANSSVADAHECGIDVCGTLSQDANLLTQAANSINVGDRFTAVQNAIQQDLVNLNNLTQAYDSIYDYINQEISANGQSASGPDVLVSWDNNTKNNYGDFYNNVASLVNNSKDAINNGIQAIYANTYAVPNNLWQNANFQLPEISLANEDTMLNCTTGLTQWANEVAAEEAAIAADKARAAAAAANSSSSNSTA